MIHFFTIRRAFGTAKKSVLALMAGLFLLGATATTAWAGEKKVYTVFDESTKTLTYYCDDQMNSRAGVKEVYDMSDGLYIRLKDYYQKIEKAVIDVSMKDTALTTTSCMFLGTYYDGEDTELYYLSNLTSIEGLENLNTENVTGMPNMFNGCSSLTLLDLSSFNTAKVKSMGRMFHGCSSLTSLDLSSFNTAKVIDMFAMFYGCSSLKTIYCNDDWSQNEGLTSSEDMFKGCTSIQGGRGTGYRESFTDKKYARPDKYKQPGYFTKKKTGKQIYTVFDESTKTLTYYCDNLIDDDAARPGIKEEYDMSEDVLPTRLKNYYQKIEKAVIDVSMKDTALTSTQCMFMGTHFNGDVSEFYCLSNLKSIEGLENLNTEKVTHMQQMFYGCSSLTSLDLSTFNTAEVMTMWAMFQGCSSLTLLDLRSFNIANVRETLAMFSGCSALTTIYCNEDWSESSKLASSENMFKGCTSLKGRFGTVCDGTNNLNKRYARPDEAGRPGYFSKKRAEKLIYTVFDESTNILTYYCDDQIDDDDVRPGIKEEYEAKLNQVRWRKYHDKVLKVIIDESLKDTALTSTACLFYGGRETVTQYSLSSLTRIEGMENLKTSKVTDMSNMFAECVKLKSVDLSALKTGNVKNMHGMFEGCRAMESIDLSAFNTAKVKDMSSMFAYCTALKALEFVNYDISSLTDASDMFFGCHALTAIYCDDNWAIYGNLTQFESMFGECFKLVGEQGSKCDGQNRITKYYAMLDQGEKNKGYFSHVSDEVTIGDIRYKLYHGSKTATVLPMPEGKYEGDINIPAPITYKGKVYAVTTIGEKAFFECPDLQTITLGNRIEKIENQAIYGNPDLYYILVDKNNSHFCDREGVLFSKDSKTLYVFPPSRETNYSVPEGVEKIAKYAFSGSQVTSLVLPPSLEKINESAFSPNALEKIISQTVTPPTLGKDVFAGISGLASVYVPSASMEAYKSADGWKDLNILSAVDAQGVLIGDLYYNLYSEDMSAEVTSSPDRYSGLDEIIIPQTVEYDGFEFVVTKIGKRAFMDCEDFSYLVMPNSITEVDDEACYGALGLEYVRFSDQLTRIGNTAFGKAGIVDLQLPNNLEYIDEMAFAGSEVTDTVRIPSGVRYIGPSAFDGCYNMVHIEIGMGVREIGSYAFSGGSLESVVALPIIVPIIGKDVFWTSENTLSDIQVPCRMLTPYQEDKGWKEYADLMHEPPLPYEVVILPSSHGTVEVPEADCRTEIAISAIPDEGYEFLQWTDGNMDSYRVIELTQDTVFQAEFGRKMYLWEVESNNEEWGYVSTPQTEASYPYGTVITVVAQPNPGYKFIKWSNGKPLSTYNFVLKQHTYLRAIFLPENEDPQQPVWYASITQTTVRWKPTDQGYNYILTIYLDEECTHVFYRYCFDQTGELFRVEFPAPYAPQRRAPREEEFQFTITGLTADTKYFYRLETKDDKDRVIYTDEGSFRTENAEVAAVKALIDAIGEVVYSEDCKIRIDDAQDAYNALSDEHKALITNYATLTDAGQQYEELKKAAEAALFQDKKDELKALLDALLLPDDSEACLNIVADAKAALEAIALDGGMTITENIEALEAAGRVIREQAQTDLETQREAESHSTPTGIEGQQNDLQHGADSRCKLVLRNCVMYILRDGRTYLLTGQSEQ